MRRAIVTGLVLALLAGTGWYVWAPRHGQETGARPSVIVPDLTAVQARGAELFAETCAACHGEAASGTEQGPPLVHKIYEPSHHGDAAFFLAVTRGVRAHHWSFGDMPPQPQVGMEDIEPIVAYVRALQRANGIN